MKINLELKEIELNEADAVDEWVERSSKRSKFVEEWEKRIVEEAIAVS